MQRVLQIDTRQQAHKHDRKHADFERMGIPSVRSKLRTVRMPSSPRASS